MAIRPQSHSRLRSRRFRVEALEERRLMAACDPDDNGEITHVDIAILASNFGTTGAGDRAGDCNEDGSIDILDIGIMQSHFGVRSIDYGDAPDRPYPTKLANNGARHVIRAGFHLGAAIDRDPNGQPTLLANGDDADADGDDEDGVFFETVPTPGDLERVRVVASAPGRLDAWVDWTRDGDWNDAGEQIFASQVLAAGPQLLFYTVPAGTVTDPDRPTYARFRFSRAGGLLPTGLAEDGEVEDYTLFVLDADSVPPNTHHTFSWDVEADLAPVSTEGELLRLEASGPVTVELSPAVNTNNGMPLPNGSWVPNGTFVPNGSWYVGAQLFGMDLTGTVAEQQGTEVKYYTITLTNASATLPTPGGIMLAQMSDGNWAVDSFFDINYEIEFTETRGGTAIGPQDGSTRIAKQAVMSENALSENALAQNALSDNRLAEIEIGEALVAVNPPHAVWGHLGGFTTHIPRLDWGDAPDGPYPTLAVNSGAAHVIRPGYSMGPVVDAESNGQPSPLATRDDTNGVPDDEDGVVITSALAPGGITTVDVTAVGGKGYLNAWADFNRNGVWEASEQIFNSELLSMGVNSLAFPVPAGTIPEAAGIPPVISRWRFSRQKALATTGLSSSGDVEDHHLRISQPPTADFGDAPDGPYRTLSSNGGAAHTIVAGAHLGQFVDADTDGQPDPLAMKDNANGGPDDEDGVTFLTPLVPGGVAGVKVEASIPGRLNAFIDFNHDGVWDVGTEQVFINTALAAGPNALQFSVPANAAGGRTYARFRFSRAGGLGPAGPAPDGEVEDYVVHVEPAAGAAPAVHLSQSDLDGVHGSVQFAQPSFTEVELGGQKWTQIFVPGTEALAGEVGKPAVPIFRRLVAIPHGANVSARSVRSAASYDVKIDDVFGTRGLLPYQPAALDEVTYLEDYPSALFDEPTRLAIDQAAYASDALFPRQLVSFTPLGKLRDLEVGLLEIATGQVNPVTNRLTLFASVEWEVGFTGGDRYFLPKEAKGPFENATAQYGSVLNSNAALEYYEPGVIQPIPCGSADLGEELMILTNPMFRPAADTLAAWKEQKGIVTTVFDVGVGTARDTKEEIRDLINFRYDNCPVRPSYVMLLGDAEFIPTWYHQQVGGAAKVSANQDVDNGQWVLLGTVNFRADGGEEIKVRRLERNDDDPHNGRTVADAMRLVKVGTGQEVIVDNDGPGFSTTGAWGASAAVDQYGATSLYTNEVDATASWALPNLPGAGLY